MLTPRRIESHELLDEHDAPREEMERSLRDLRRINKYLGGIAAYKRLLRSLCADEISGLPVEPPPPRWRGRPQATAQRSPHGDSATEGGGSSTGLRSILDIGAGTCDDLEAVPEVPLRIGLDFKIDHLLYLRQPGIHRVVGDAHHLPFRDNAVDAVTSAHFFHHFSPDENVVILRECIRVARRGVAVNDSRRHYVPLLFIQLVAALRLIGPITRNDGPASVRQGYTIEEAKNVAEQAPASKRQIVRLWPFKLGILLWK